LISQLPITLPLADDSGLAATLRLKET
jgi:hypothetical protein